jgi:hypothetical protein
MRYSLRFSALLVFEFEALFLTTDLSFLQSGFGFGTIGENGQCEASILFLKRNDGICAYNEGSLASIGFFEKE